MRRRGEGGRRRVGCVWGGDGRRAAIVSPRPPPSSRRASRAARAAVPLRGARCDLSAAPAPSALSAGSGTRAQIAATANLPAPPSPVPPRPARPRAPPPRPRARRCPRAPRPRAALSRPCWPAGPSRARARASRAPAEVRVPDVRPAARLRLRCSSPPHSRQESPAGACVTLLGARPSTGSRSGVTGLMVEWQASAETAVEGSGAELTQPGAPTTFKSPLWGN